MRSLTSMATKISLITKMGQFIAPEAEAAASDGPGARRTDKAEICKAFQMANHNAPQ
jgi:hypothetical protein